MDAWRLLDYAVAFALGVVAGLLVATVSKGIPDKEQ
jgi:hypothetical protein